MTATTGQCVYLTFDDGPDPTWTPRILDLLARSGMQATFFMIGRQAQRVPSLVRRVRAEGHEIGNHTFSHRHPWLMAPQAARGEVRQGSQVLSDILGAVPLWYRPPHGRCRACMIEEARKLGQQLVLWDFSALDWGPSGSRLRIERRLARVGPRQIVLMHDGPQRHNRPDQLLEVLPAFLTHLAQRPLPSVTLSGGELPCAARL